MSKLSPIQDINFIEFKVQTLKVILWICIGIIGLYDLSVTLKFTYSPVPQIIVYNAFLATSLGLLYWLTKTPSHIKSISQVLALAAYLAFSITVFEHPENFFRFIWFLPLIIFAFFFIGFYFGVLITVASITTAGLFYGLASHMPNEAIGTLVLSFTAVAYLANHYSNQLASYEQHISEQTEALKKLITHDPMTGILNRYGLMEIASHYCNLAKRDRDLELSLIIFDIDHFKYINDEHGHLAGDDALVFLTEQVNRYTRKSDLFARLGGDEFVLLLPYTSAKNAYHLIETIRGHLAKHPFKTGKHELFIRISAGITQRTLHIKNFEHLFSEADEALYQAKQAGRNQTMAYQTYRELTRA